MSSVSAWGGFMKQSQSQQSKSKTANKRKRKTNPNSTANARTQEPLSKKRKISNMQTIQCPMCDKKLLPNLINFHIETHFANESKCNESPQIKKLKQSQTKQQSQNQNIKQLKEDINTTNSCPKTKICPLFTSGALPSSMFDKKTKNKSSKAVAQECIFYLDITLDTSSNFIQSWSAKWINDKTQIKDFLFSCAQKKYFINSVLIKEPNTSGPSKIWLITNLESRKEGTINIMSNECKFRWNHLRFSPSLVKSLLQKCVRVSFEESAVKAAYLLMIKDSLQGLLRRLSIIMIEDVILMNDLVPLTWLLLAESKSDQTQKYHPSMCWFNFIFSVVYKCAKCKIKDVIHYDLCPKNEEFITLFTPMHRENDQNDQNEENGMKQLLIRCMLMRAAYGGMKCDVAMLRSYSCIWHNRFFGKTQFCKFYQSECVQLNGISDGIKSILTDGNAMEKVSDLQNILDTNDWMLFLKKLDVNERKLRMNDILPMNDNDLILSAVDFHCSNMLSALCENGNGKCWNIIMEHMRNGGNVMYDVEGYLKTMVWEYRSSLTDKIGLLMEEEKRTDLIELWEKVKPIVNDFSLRHYRLRINKF